MANIIPVVIGGALGALLRYFVSTFAVKHFGTSFPYGTLIVNTIGSFLMVFFMILFFEKLNASDSWRLFFAVGFLGALTTFSSFSYETIMLFEKGNITKGILNIILNNVFSISAGVLGFIVARYFIYKL
ncbi:MAG TPA: fluoride efflux transporter CrcB [Persephonella sp.]|nr:fluoride efflux transporter CrcB [Hydrogenothermaceae bacterium]HIQ24598.1 fluoride efflux transporter CrcB [Persephonella sp.]